MSIVSRSFVTFCGTVWTHSTVSRRVVSRGRTYGAFQCYTFTALCNALSGQMASNGGFCLNSVIAECYANSFGCHVILSNATARCFNGCYRQIIGGQEQVRNRFKTKAFCSAQVVNTAHFIWVGLRFVTVTIHGFIIRCYIGRENGRAFP